VLKFDEAAHLRLGDKKIKAGITKGIGEESAQVLKRAERLGYWFAAAGSTRTVFNIMGLTV
jgi:hypothetical protein